MQIPKANIHNVAPDGRRGKVKMSVKHINKMGTIIIDNQLLSSLSSLAKSSPRLRQAYDLRNNEGDSSQRMLNALEPGTVMPIHRHRKTSETICMVRGKMVMRLYDDKGNVTDKFVMEHCGEYPMVQVEAGQWHSLEVLEEATVVFVAKNGKNEAIKDEDIMM